MSAAFLPIFLKGEVVSGFGRGSKELGCPTANFTREVIQNLPPSVKPGVYYGWAKVADGPVYKMVANIGWCPYYNNKDMSVETHIIHKFDKDFYGEILKIILVGYLRGEKNFGDLQQLIEAIQQDISDAETALEEFEAQKLKEHLYFDS